MLSRVCCLDQLIILGKLSTDKIKADPKVISEARRMEEVSVNKNPTKWNSVLLKGSRISSVNVRSLRKHIDDVRIDPVLLKSDMICVQETWLEQDEDESEYHIDGYQAHFNSQGRGKGIAVYTKASKFMHVIDWRSDSLQMSKLSSDSLDVIVVYRSQEEPFLSLTTNLQTMLSPQKTTLVVGDINFCYINKSNQFSVFLETSEFQQLAKTATHIEGALLDQAYFKRVGGGDPAHVELFSNYYSDHDTVTVLVP